MKKIESNLEHKELINALHYDMQSGLFTWKYLRFNTYLIGETAGRIANNRRRIRIKNIEYGACRLAWFYVYKVWPKNEIDHIDGDPSNDAIVNLRDVSRMMNSQNLRRAYKNNKLGVQGVCFFRGRYLVQLQAQGRRYRVGSFVTIREAKNAYLSAKRKFHLGNTL